MRFLRVFISRIERLIWLIRVFSKFSRSGEISYRVRSLTENQFIFTVERNVFGNALPEPSHFRKLLSSPLLYSDEVLQIQLMTCLPQEGDYVCLYFQRKVAFHFGYGFKECLGLGVNKCLFSMGAFRKNEWICFPLHIYHVLGSVVRANMEIDK